jgi:prepilin-type processing-associated H-X9-DG protein
MEYFQVSALRDLFTSSCGAACAGSSNLVTNLIRDNHIYTPNSQAYDCRGCNEPDGDGEEAIITARSYHPGGVNVLMADGQVRFVGDGVNEKIWRAIATKSGSEAIDNTAF